MLAAARALGNLLQSHGERHWADWVLGDRQRIHGGDAPRVDHLLAAYGGMGSLNDVVIDPVNGHHIAVQDVATANAQLSQLRSRTYAAAMRLKAAQANFYTPEQPWRRRASVRAIGGAARMVADYPRWHDR